MASDEVKREGWTADELGEESSYEGRTEHGRRLRRGDETKGDANSRDVAGDHIPAQKSPPNEEK